MASCPSCGKEMPGEFPFCPFCGAPLVVEPARLVAEERKVVTVLFCDLVGFTAAAERGDPEDIDRMLSEYAAVARGLIESHGGVMEKFIGDAAVGVEALEATPWLERVIAAEADQQARVSA